MTRIDVDKDEVFAVIKDSISPEYNNPNEEQQEGINLLEILSGFNPNPEVPVVAAANEAIMHRSTFLTVKETREIWYYDNGVYTRGGEIIIAKEAEQIRLRDLL